MYLVINKNFNLKCPESLIQLFSNNFNQGEKARKRLVF